MRTPSAYLGLGSNQDAPGHQLELALFRLERFGVGIERVSSRYLTEPVGGPRQPWFVNAAAGVRFDGEPDALLRLLQRVETEQGRRRDVPNGPRTLDLDLLLFGEEIRRTPHLTLPHPRLEERRFVLVPMVEIAPEVRDPRSGLTMRELLARCPDVSEVRRLEPGVPVVAGTPSGSVR